MQTKVESASAVKEGWHIIIDNEPCRVIEVAHSKPGKHGATKVRLVALGLFDGKKRDVVMPGDEPVQVPSIEKRTAQVLAVSGNRATVMDLESYETFDLELPEGTAVAPGCQVIYWQLLGRRIFRQIRA